MSNYDPFSTAIRRKELSKPMRELYLKGLLDGKTVLDYGCGYGEDVNQLREKGINAHSYDLYNPEYSSSAIFKKEFDAVTCHYVFNVIPNLDEHRTTLKNLKYISNEVFISVRADTKAIKKSWKYDAEAKGYWTGNKRTFQRFYDKKLVKELFGEVEYIYTNASVMIFKLI